MDWWDCLEMLGRSGIGEARRSDLPVLREYGFGAMINSGGCFVQMCPPTHKLALIVFFGVLTYL